MLSVHNLRQWPRDCPKRLRQRSPYFILAICCCALFLDLTNLSAITIALPTIQRELSVSTGNLQWVISGYALTFGSFLLLGGRAGDLYSHRTVMIVGLGLFSISTLACALVPSFVGLVVCRAFQGLGAALTVPSAQAHIPLYFTEPKARAKALGFWGATGSLGFIVGLILGGAVTDKITWRWIFWISLMFSCILVVVAIFLLPHPETRADNQARATTQSEKKVSTVLQAAKTTLIAFDAAGVALIVPAMLLLTYALSAANEKGWSNSSILVTLILAIVLIVTFGVYESRIEKPLIPLHLFRSIDFNLNLVGAINLYAIRQAATYFLTLQLQSFGNTPLQTSLLYLPMGISSLILTFAAARLVPILGARVMLTTGWIALIAGVIFFSLTSAMRSFWWTTFIAEIISPYGIGAIGLTSNFLIMAMASKEQQGVVAGVYNVALQIGGSVLGLAALTAVAQGIGEDLAPLTPNGTFPEVSFLAVYYSCAILGGISLIISAFLIRCPESLRGRKLVMLRARSSPDAEANAKETKEIAVQTGPSLAGSLVGSKRSSRCGTESPDLSACSKRSSVVMVPHSFIDDAGHCETHLRDSVHSSTQHQLFKTVDNARARVASPTSTQMDIQPPIRSYMPTSRYQRLPRKPVSAARGPPQRPNDSLPVVAHPYRHIEYSPHVSTRRMPHIWEDTATQETPYTSVVTTNSRQLPVEVGEGDSDRLSCYSEDQEEIPNPMRRSLLPIAESMGAGARSSWRNSWTRIETPRFDSHFSLATLTDELGLEKFIV